MVKDPVCDMTVVPEDAAGTSTYKGENIYFCSIQCKERFDKDPASFITAAAPQGSTHYPKEKQIFWCVFCIPQSKSPMKISID